MDLPAIKSVCSLSNVTQPEISCPESQDFLSTLPTEMFRAILERVRILEMIPLRLVSNRWKVVIESICSDKKYLVIKHQPNRYYLRTKLLKRFNLNELSKDSVVFKLKYYQREVIHLSGHLCTLLSKLFPRLEQFYILDYATYSSTEFNSMLHQWSSSLTSLCVRLHYSEDVNELCAQINQLTNLRQLNLDTLPGSGTQYCQLAPTLARLEYLSGSGYETIDKIAPYLGENFSSLGFARSNIVPYMKLEELTNWYHLNAQSVSNLVCFSLYSNDDAIFPFICKHFSSLQVLRIYVGYSRLTPMIRQLVQLTHLTELHIDGNWIDVAALEDFSLRPLRNIRILTLVDFSLVEAHEQYLQTFDFYLPENVDVRFIRFVSSIFPNVEQLTIKCADHAQFGNLLEPHLNLFANLRWHDFGLGKPAIRLMDNGDQTE